MTNQTTYRRRNVVSPYQLKPQQPHPVEQMRAAAYNTQDKAHPVRALIQNCLGEHVIKAVVEEDLQTLATLKGVDGLIAFLCTLTTQDGRVLAQGRGSAVLGPNTRFLSKTVACAFNSCISDAAIRSTRVLDNLRDKSEVEIEEAARDSESAPATEKQCQFLKQLIRKIEDRAERENWEIRLGELTKSEASRAIETFKR